MTGLGNILMLFITSKCFVCLKSTKYSERAKQSSEQDWYLWGGIQWHTMADNMNSVDNKYSHLFLVFVVCRVAFVFSRWACVCSRAYRWRLVWLSIVSSSIQFLFGYDLVAHTCERQIMEDFNCDDSCTPHKRYSQSHVLCCNTHIIYFENPWTNRTRDCVETHIANSWCDEPFVLSKVFFFPFVSKGCHSMCTTLLGNFSVLCFVFSTKC